MGWFGTDPAGGIEEILFMLVFLGGFGAGTGFFFGLGLRLLLDEYCWRCRALRGAGVITGFRRSAKTEDAWYHAIVSQGADNGRDRVDVAGGPQPPQVGTSVKVYWLPDAPWQVRTGEPNRGGLIAFAVVGIVMAMFIVFTLPAIFAWQLSVVSGLLGPFGVAAAAVLIHRARRQPRDAEGGDGHEI